MKKIITDYVEEKDWRVKENSNMGYSLQGLNNHIVAHAMSDYWLKEIYPPLIGDMHLNGDIHIHDLSSLSTYCLGWDLKDILIQGFTGVVGKVESAPAKHLRSALGQLVNFFYTLQGEAAGAQAVSSFDTYLAPFVRYDKLNYQQVKQHIQEFIFNMNVPTRTGFQTVFSNLTLDIIPGKEVGDENVIIGGEIQKEKYKDFQKEMDMINMTFCDVMMEGDAKGGIFSFPIPTYNITKDFNWDSKVADKIFEMTGKYGIPYFSNFINSDLKPEDIRSMCCRLRILNKELKRKGGGLFGANPLTGSIGVVTINLPRIGYLSKSEEEFFGRLEDLMDIAKKSLIIKRAILEKNMEKGLYPYSKHYLRLVYQRFGKYWKNHFSTIGLVGMNEALLNFNSEDMTTKKGVEFAEKVLNFMRDRLTEYQEETDDVWNLEATPAEGTTRRLATFDKKRYPDIIVANGKNYREKGVVPYYTNSSQLPVGYTDDVFEALDLQDNIQTLYTGGTTFHTFLGEAMPSVKSVKNLVRKIAENYRLPYFTITPSFSICPKHGYLSGEHKYCPKCDAEMGIINNI